MPSAAAPSEIESLQVSCTYSWHTVCEACANWSLSFIFHLCLFTYIYITCAKLFTCTCRSTVVEAKLLHSNIVCFAVLASYGFLLEAHVL